MRERRASDVLMSFFFFFRDPNEHKTRQERQVLGQKNRTETLM